MRKAFLALVLILFLGNCFADGMMVMPPDYSEKVFMPEQKAVIVWDGSTEELILESKITTEDISSMAWLIPIESSTKPVVEAADEEVFFRLSDLFTPRPKGNVYPTIFGVTGSMERGGVEVIEELKVDIYDITILKATDSSALINWLNSNGYSFPEAFPNLLDEYVASGNTYFIANKINLQNKYPGINPSSEDFECAQAITEDKWIGERFYGGSDSIERTVDYMMDQFPSECHSADSEAIAVLVSLRLGISTPLKISFTPSKPIYPMKISSLNLGDGKALVYFVSNKAFKDSSGIFSTKNMIQGTPISLNHYGIETGSTVTLLEWSDSYSSLAKDSFFEERPFVPELDPNFVPFHETASEFLFMLLIFLVFFVLVLAMPLLVIPFFLGMLASLVLERKKKKKSVFSNYNGMAGLAMAALLILIGPTVFSGFLFLMTMSINVLIGSIFAFLILGSIIFTPYYISMACGFFFKKSKYRLRFLLGPIIAAVIFLAIVLLIAPL